MFVLLISIVLALIIVIFAIQNAIVVPIDFLFWSTDLPLVIVIFCSVFAGALLMFFLALWRELKYKIGKREIKSKLNPIKSNNSVEEKIKETQTDLIKKTNDEDNKEQFDNKDQQMISK